MDNSFKMGDIELSIDFTYFIVEIDWLEMRIDLNCWMYGNKNNIGFINKIQIHFLLQELFVKMTIKTTRSQGLQ